MPDQIRLEDDSPSPTNERPKRIPLGLSDSILIEAKRL
jgi:hypothetical protein